MSDVWFVSYHIPGSPSTARTVSGRMLDGSEGEWVWVPRFHLFPADLPLSLFLHGRMLTQLDQEGWLLCVSNAILTLKLILGINVLMKFLEKATEKSHFLLHKPKGTIPPRKILLTLKSVDFLSYQSWVESHLFHPELGGKTEEPASITRLEQWPIDWVATGRSFNLSELHHCN